MLRHLQASLIVAAASTVAPLPLGAADFYAGRTVVIARAKRAIRP